jgi:hypothetical protein
MRAMRFRGPAVQAAIVGFAALATEEIVKT